jgi:molecular chaperone DnaJ
VQPDATPAQIKEAYRRLAKKYHPDTNRGDPQAEERFKRLSEAYHILSDPDKRLIYHRKEAVRQKSKAKRAATSSQQSTGFADIFKEVFKKGFGNFAERKQEQEPRMGANIKVSIELDDLELAAGAQKPVTLKRERLCETCTGTGVKPGHKPVNCPICLGIGEVPQVRDGVTQFTTCTNCKGKGTIVRERCMDCGGRGIKKARSTITIDVPAGTQPGAKIRLRGQGHVGFGGAPNGDLLVDIVAKENEYFHARGHDLIYDYPLTVREMFLGGEIEVPTRDGKVKLNLTAGIPQGKILRVQGKGLPKKEGGRGDLLVRIQYHIPDKISVRARELLDELSEMPRWSPKRDRKGYVPRSKKG